MVAQNHHIFFTCTYFQKKSLLLCHSACLRMCEDTFSLTFYCIILKAFKRLPLTYVNAYAYQDKTEDSLSKNMYYVQALVLYNIKFDKLRK